MEQAGLLAPLLGLGGLLPVAGLRVESGRHNVQGQAEQMAGVVEDYAAVVAEAVW